MRIKRCLAALLALALMLGCAHAESAFTTAVQALSKEEIQSFVECMFAAVIGTTVDDEASLLKDKSTEEKQARDAENAAYREITMPWLIAALQPESAAETMPDDEQQDEDASEPAYTTSDSYRAFQERPCGQTYLTALARMGASDEEAALQLTREICAQWMAQVDDENLWEMNEDYACWIYVPDGQIDYPVVQGTDNKYYLNHLFNRTSNSSGTLFIDYRNLADFQDPNTLIYGHHMRNGSMFGMLTHYSRQSYYESHPLALVMTEKSIFLLEFFAGYTTTHDDHCYDIAISDEEDMMAFVEKAGRKSEFASSVEVQPTDHLVTLSTCAYAFENARYILIGKITTVWEADTENVIGE